MADTIRIKRRTSGAPGAPASLANAELAYNEVDNILYYGEGTGGAGGTATTVVPIAGPGWITGSYLPLIGGTLTGDLIIAPAAGAAEIYLCKSASGFDNTIIGQVGAGLARWGISLGNVTAESGSNVGSDFAIHRYSDAGAYIQSPLSINRATGAVSIAAALGVGFATAPAGRLHIGGTYTTANASVIHVATNLASSSLGTQNGLFLQPTFAPAGASVSQLVGAQFVPQISTTALAIAAAHAVYIDFTFSAGYTGVVTNTYGIHIADITGALNQLPTVRQYFAQTLTNGNGLTTGVVGNYNFFGSGSAAGSAGGQVFNRTAQFNVPSGGSTAGGTFNTGVHITGNGGTAAGGAVVNYALFSDSTAPIQIGGLFQFLGATSAFPALKRSGTALQHRLADDSAYGGVEASTLGLGTAAAAQFHVAGTFASTVVGLLRVDGTFASSQTALQRLATINPTYAPTGASLSEINNIWLFPQINSTAFTIPVFRGIMSGFSLGASFTGTVTRADLFQAMSPTTLGNPITTLIGYHAAVFANGNNLAAGTVTNAGFYGEGISSAAAGATATVNNRTAQFVVPYGGSTVAGGVANNDGILITGVGGTSTGGTVNNYALHSTSSAVTQIDGPVVVGAPTGGSKGAGTINAVSVYGNNVLLTSDAARKTDIEPLTGCLQLVDRVVPRSYRWLPLDPPARVPDDDDACDGMPAGFTERRNLGFLSSDVAAALGAADDGAVDLGSLVAVMWQAVKELSAKVAALEKE